MIWRKTLDEEHRSVFEIAEVWVAGARSDDEIYIEMRNRLAKLKEQGGPQARPLVEVLESLSKQYSKAQARPKPASPENLPDWLVQGLEAELHLPKEKIATLTRDEAHHLMIDHWSRKK